MTERASRDPFGDAVRGLAIMGVVCIHGLDSVLPSAAYQAVSQYFRWCVPAFIFLTAFYTPSALQGHPRGFVDTCLPRLQRLAWPFAVYSALYLALAPHPFDIPLAKLFSTHLSGYGWPGQYYFIILFQLVPVLYLMSRTRLPGYIVVMMFAWGLISYGLAPTGYRDVPILAKLADRPFWYWLPYLALGLYAAQHRAQLRQVASRANTHLLLLLALALPCLLIWSGPPAGQDSPYLRPQVLLVSTAFLFLMRMVFEQMAAPGWLQYIGRYSLSIFCLNPLFIMLARSALPAMNTIQTSWGSAITASMAMLLFVMMASLLTGKLLRSMGLPQLAA